MFALAFGALVVAAQKASAPHLDQGMKELVKSVDLNFAMRAAEASMAQVKLGQLAAEKSESGQLKAFGQQMVKDHSTAESEVEAIAGKERMTLPAVMNGKDEAEFRKLEKLSGSAFDRVYTKDIVKEHTEDVKVFEKETKSGKNEELKAFAAKTLPQIQSHLEQIKSIETQLKGR